MLLLLLGALGQSTMFSLPRERGEVLGADVNRSEIEAALARTSLTCLAIRDRFPLISDLGEGPIWLPLPRAHGDPIVVSGRYWPHELR